MSKHTPRKAFARAVDDAPESLNDLPRPAPESAAALAVQPPGAGTSLVIEDDESLTPYIDENGFDPADYKWVPVRRRPRADGWSEAKQRLFIETLADTGVVDEAAATVGMSRASCYALRRSPGAEAFSEAWSAAIHQASLKLVDLAFDRAINGSDEPVFDSEGRRVGRRMKTNDRLLMFLMRAHMPERYRHAHLSSRGGAEPPAPPSIPVAQAIATLEPALPADPHLLLAPDELDAEIEVADIGDGNLPHWYRDKMGEEPGLGISAEFEAALEDAKVAAAAANYVPPEHWDDEDWDREA